MNDVRLDGRVVIVTGAGMGLGRSHALLLAERGAAVVVNDVDPSAAGSTVDDIVGKGGRAVSAIASMGDPDGATAVVSSAIDSYGRIDGLVNNAGIVRDRSFAKMEAAELEAVLTVHLKGSFFMAQAAWSALRESGTGRIVNTTSMAATVGNFGQANYAAAKAGLIGLTKTLAIEGSRTGILVNAISPAAETRMTNGLFDDTTASHLDPGLVSPVVAFLQSAECEVSGEVFAAGGGRVARVFFAQGEGFHSPTLSVEDVRDNLETIRSTQGWSEPITVNDELQLMGRHWS